MLLPNPHRPIEDETTHERRRRILTRIAGTFHIPVTSMVLHSDTLGYQHYTIVLSASSADQIQQMVSTERDKGVVYTWDAATKTLNVQIQRIAPRKYASWQYVAGTIGLITLIALIFWP